MISVGLAIILVLVTLSMLFAIITITDLGDKKYQKPSLSVNNNQRYERHFQLKRKLLSEWKIENPILKDGEIVIAFKDENHEEGYIYIGNGKLHFSELKPFVTNIK